MHIGIDFDGVIADSGHLKTLGAKELFNISIPPEKLKKEILIKEGFLTSEQYHILRENLYGTSAIASKMQLVSGVLTYIPALLRDGHKITVVTSRSGDALNIAQDWLCERGFFLNFVGVGYGNSKAAAARGLACYIDDDLDKLEPLRDIVPHRFLFSWGYNVHEDARDIARRIHSWEKFYEAIQQLNSAR